MLSFVEKYFLAVVTGQKKGLWPFILRLFLWFISLPYAFYTTCRNWMYDHHWLRRYFPPIPVVISIGNIVVGGTGKTPVTLKIAENFANDYSIAILSRGYRSPAEKLATPIILSNGKGPMQSAAFCGDEPFMLSKRIPNAFVIVGKDRHKAADIAAREGVQLILIDDGMQHRRLARDFDVVVVDAADMFGQGYFLPRGLLREGPSGLSRASIVIVNHVESEASFKEIKEKLKQYTSAPIIGTQVQISGIKTLSGELIDSIDKKKIGIFCGIAHPEYFHRTVSALGAEIVHSFYKADHKGFSQKQLGAFATSCKALGAEYILCTEKDRIKITDIQAYAIPIVWMEICLAVIEGQSDFQDFIDKVKRKIS